MTIISDERYNLWLQQHEQANCSKASLNPLPTASNLLLGDRSHQTSVLKRITQLPKPPPLSTQSYSDKCGKVLTSSENRRIIEEKEKLKLQKLQEKEKRKEDRWRK